MRRAFTTPLTALVVAAGLLLSGCATEDTKKDPAPSPGTVGVDLVYLNHPPVKPVLEDIDKVLDTYEGKVTVFRHDADTADGKDFAAGHDLTGHVMIAVLIDGKVRFRGFPIGRAPMKAAEGDWRMDDLDRALKERTEGGTS
ncbi:hypothetical protein ACFPM3_12150 [Streptomyces coeruleoprunus]|uniref:Lipoprotein n=1 Tax=Streptomyces coeruleoprunus TaxID=285563 RepID=A0ABV9XDQ2_9ACTN